MTINTASAELRGPQSRELLEHLESVISSQRFIEKQGLNNEVPFSSAPIGQRMRLRWRFCGRSS